MELDFPGEISQRLNTETIDDQPLSSDWKARKGDENSVLLREDRMSLLLLSGRPTALDLLLGKD